MALNQRHDKISYAKVAAALLIILVVLGTVAQARFFCSSASADAASKRPNFSEFPLKSAFYNDEKILSHSYPKKILAKDYNTQLGLALGPIHVRDIATGGRCTADIGLIERLFIEQTRRAMLVISRSGSTTYIHGISLSDCSSLWPEITAITSRVDVVVDRIEISATCIETDESSISQCWAGQVFRLGQNFNLVSLPVFASQLTKSNIGVAFTGQKFVQNAGKKTAKIISTPANLR